MWLEYWLNEHQRSDLPASVPLLAAVPAWVGLEKDARLASAISASDDDSAATAPHLALAALDAVR